MTDRLTDEDLKRLRELADKATPGPLYRGEAAQAVIRYPDWGDVYDGRGWRIASFCTNAVATEAEKAACRAAGIDDGGWHEPPQVAANAEFFVAARDALPRLLSEVTALRDNVEVLGRNLELSRGQALDNGRLAHRALTRAQAAEALIAEVRAIVTAERQAFGPSAFSDALWETLTADDAVTAPAEPAGAVQGGGAVSGEVGAAKSDTQTFVRPMTWAGLGKD